MSLHPRCQCDSLTTKCVVRNPTSSHCGREFWRCPNWQTSDKDCKFFQWTDQNNPLDFHKPKVFRHRTVNRNAEGPSEPPSANTITGQAPPPQFDQFSNSNDFPVTKSPSPRSSNAAGCLTLPARSHKLSCTNASSDRFGISDDLQAPKSPSLRTSDARGSLNLSSIPAHPHTSSCPDTPPGRFDISGDLPVSKSPSLRFSDVHKSSTLQSSLPTDFHTSPPPFPSTPLEDHELSDTSSSVGDENDENVRNQKEEEAEVDLIKQEVSTPKALPIRPSIPLHRKVLDPPKNGINANCTTPTRTHQSQSSKPRAKTGVTPALTDLKLKDSSKVATLPTLPSPIPLAPTISFGAPHTHASNLTATQIIDLVTNHLHRTDFLAAYQAQTIDKLHKELVNAEQRVRNLEIDIEELQKQYCNVKRKLDQALRGNV